MATMTLTRIIFASIDNWVDYNENKSYLLRYFKYQICDWQTTNPSRYFKAINQLQALLFKFKVIIVFSSVNEIIVCFL